MERLLEEREHSEGSKIMFEDDCEDMEENEGEKEKKCRERIMREPLQDGIITKETRCRMEEIEVETNKKDGHLLSETKPIINEKALDKTNDSTRSTRAEQDSSKPVGRESKKQVFQTATEQIDHMSSLYGKHLCKDHIRYIQHTAIPEGYINKCHRSVEEGKGGNNGNSQGYRHVVGYNRNDDHHLRVGNNRSDNHNGNSPMDHGNLREGLESVCGERRRKCQDGGDRGDEFKDDQYKQMQMIEKSSSRVRTSNFN